MSLGSENEVLQVAQKLIRRRHRQRHCHCPHYHHLWRLTLEDWMIINVVGLMCTSVVVSVVVSVHMFPLEELRTISSFCTLLSKSLCVYASTHYLHLHYVLWRHEILTQRISTERARNLINIMQTTYVQMTGKKNLRRRRSRSPLE